MKKYYKDLKNYYGLKKIFQNILLYLLFILIAINKVVFDFIKNNWIIIGVISLLLLSKIVSLKTFKMYIKKWINYIDVILNSLLLCIIILIIYYLLDKNYKALYILLGILFVLIILTICRVIIINKKDVKKENTIDLKELCKSKIDLALENFVLLDENEIDYDLLNRNHIINELYNTILKSYPKKTLGIGIEGEWGSGKTTLINNVLRIIKDNIPNDFVIVKFDPWAYNDEKAMLKGLINEILSKMDIDLNLTNFNALIKEFINIIFYSNSSLIEVFDINEEENVKLKIANTINNYLTNENKRLLLIIDNLDRIDVEKIKFLFSILDTNIDFEKTIIVYLYDEKIVNSAFATLYKTKNNFFKKFIQLKFKVPYINNTSLDYIKNKLMENVSYKGEYFLKNVLDDNIDFNSIRDLKQFINNIFSNVDGDNFNLNFKDFVYLEYIKTVNSDLFYNIWHNKKYYTSIIGYEKSEEFKNFFDNLFKEEKNAKLKKLLAEMFPTINKICYNNYTSDDYFNNLKNVRICNSRCFDSYFTRCENDYIKMNKIVQQLIYNINNNERYKLNRSLRNLFNKFDKDEIKLFMQVFDVFINDINKSKILIIIENFYSFFPFMPDRTIFFERDAKERCIYIIAELLSNASKGDIKKYCYKISRDYKNLYVLFHIISIFEKEKLNIDALNLLKDKSIAISGEIFQKNVNMFSDLNFHSRNIWSLLRYDEQKLKKYLNKNVNGNNVFKFLSCSVSESITQTNYGYSIEEDNLIQLLGIKKIDKLIKLHQKKLTSSEKFIISIYNKYKTEVGDNRIIYVSEVKNLDNI